MAGAEERVDPRPDWLYDGAVVSYSFFSHPCGWEWYKVVGARHRSDGWYANLGRKTQPMWTWVGCLVPGQQRPGRWPYGS